MFHRLWQSCFFSMVIAAVAVSTGSVSHAAITIVQAAGVNYDLTDPLTGLPAGATGSVTLNPALVGLLAPPAAGANIFTTFIADVAEYPGWTAVAGGALGGVLTVNTYTAHDYGTPRGGADMKATYVRNNNDPAALRWLQMFTDNTGANGALVRHIDPFPNDDGAEDEPFYYTQAQESNIFVDSPFDTVTSVPFNRTVRFETYLTSFNAMTKVVTIHDGFSWGYDVVAVPEPTTVILLLSASFSYIPQLNDIVVTSNLAIVLKAISRRARLLVPVVLSLLLYVQGCGRAPDTTETTYPSSNGNPMQIEGISAIPDNIQWGDKSFPFRSSLASEKTLYSRDEAIIVQYRLQNISTTAQSWWHAGFWSDHRIAVCNTKGELLPMTERGKKAFAAFNPNGPRRKNFEIIIEPQGIEESFAALNLLQYYDIRNQSTIEVQCYYENGDLKLLSNKLRIQMTIQRNRHCFERATSRLALTSC